ncbi:hypothetical protein R1flu_000290 [Riccia fluitans]|uniref:Uncharacterized protein n=1 Tax=Riccia fluitans TaxID=41844 RepID=A0ABD1Y012_9MARC
MKDVSEELGWSDEQNWPTLHASLLCQISTKCYSKGASYYGSPFQDFLPLFESNRIEEDHPSIIKSESSATSVETILGQHKDFSDPGEVMLTALRIGVSGDNLDDKELDLEPMLDI